MHQLGAARRDAPELVDEEDEARFANMKFLRDDEPDNDEDEDEDEEDMEQGRLLGKRSAAGVAAGVAELSEDDLISQVLNPHQSPSFFTQKLK